MSDISIRKASAGDIARFLEIYSYYVKDTAVSFEYEVPSCEEFLGRYKRISAVYPYLAAEIGNKVAGYAYAGKFHERKAYEWCAELTVYIDKNFRKCGIGKALYTELEKILKEMGVTNLYACIAVTDEEDEYLTNGSIDFHKHMGFEQIGRFHKCGHKFGRWYDMVWAEKIIGEHTSDKPGIAVFDSLGHSF